MPAAPLSARKSSDAGYSGIGLNARVCAPFARTQLSTSAQSSFAKRGNYATNGHSVHPLSHAPPVAPYSQATKKKPVPPPAETRQGPRRHIDAVAARRHAGMPACPSTAGPNAGDVESASAQQGSRWSRRAPKYRSRNGAIENSNVWKGRCSHGKRSDATTPTRSDREQRISAGSVPIYAASQCGPYHSTEDAQCAACGRKNEPVQPSDHKTWAGHAMGRNPSHLLGNRPVTRRRRARATVGDFERR